MADPKLSVLVAVYEGEDPEPFSDCLGSILNQTHVPPEVIIVKDGPLPSDLERIIDGFNQEYDGTLVAVQLPENRGSGIAYNTGIKYCSNALIAQLGSDDIATADRFEKQIEFLRKNPNVDVVGSYLEEFERESDDIVSIREVPTQPAELRNFARFRSPINHTTVMFRREPVLEVGGFDDLRRMQDYDLWVRLLMKGYTLANIPEVLARARVDTDYFDRKGGIRAFRHDIVLQYRFYRLGFVSAPTMVMNLLVRSMVKVIPNKSRKLVYEKVLRKNNTRSSSALQ